jgi:hypothetical protein
MRYPTFIISILGFLFLLCCAWVLLLPSQAKKNINFAVGDFPLAYSSTILSRAEPAVCGYYTHITTGMAVHDWKC